MSRVLHAGAVALAILAGGGCATIVSGTDQIITVDSDPQGAQCEIHQGDRLVARIDDTPDVVTVDKSDGFFEDDLFVKCRKGALCGDASNESHDAGMIGYAAGYGNLLLGPFALVGVMVDVDSGAWNKYDDAVLVVLQEC